MLFAWPLPCLVTLLWVGAGILLPGNCFVCSNPSKSANRAPNRIYPFYETFEKPGDFYHPQKDNGLF